MPVVGGMADDGSMAYDGGMADERGMEVFKSMVSHGVTESTVAKNTSLGVGLLLYRSREGRSCQDKKDLQ